MKRALLVALFFIASITQHYGANLPDIVKFADLTHAKELLSSEDVFTDAWSKFDVDSRMGKANSKKADLLKYIATQAREWTEDEIKIVKALLIEIDQQIKNQAFKINFPKEIIFVKTTTMEEGGALGYTRNNYVILNEEILSIKKEELKDIIIHEIFHVLSRNDAEFRKDMYKLVGFTVIDNVEYPAEIKDLRITNPDTPLNDCYITLENKGVKVNVMMVLYANKAYSGGSFFEYLQVGFLVLKDIKKKEFEYTNGKPVILTFKDVTNFNEQVGTNTGYVIHAEEVLADNFVFAINNRKDMPSQWLVNNIQNKLK
jgi:hypothetical protein